MSLEGVDITDDFTNEIPAEYFHPRTVPSIADVLAGLEVVVPTTIYNERDDTSGVAGLLKLNGEFILAQHPRHFAKFWEFDETDRYIRLVDEDGKPQTDPAKAWAIGSSWRVGEIVWDGSVVGSIRQQALDGDDDDKPEERSEVRRRMWDVNLTPDRPSTGELWRAIRRGTSQTGVEMGMQHLNRMSHSENAWDTFGDRREAA